MDSSRTHLTSSVMSGARASMLAVQVVRMTVADYTRELKKHMEEGMKQPKHGRIYKRPHGEHRASAPYEPPAVDSGKLIGSLVITYARSGMEGTVSTGVPYAIYLEKGTKRMKPRPYARPAFNALRVDFVEALSRRLRFTLQMA